MSDIPGPLSARRALKAALSPDEEVLVGARCDVRGVNSKAKRMVVAAIAFGAIGAAISSRRDITPAKGAMIVTQNRLLVSGGLGGLRAKLILDVDRDKVKSATADKAVAYRNVRLKLSGGEEFEFRVYRKKDAEKVLGALQPNSKGSSSQKGSDSLPSAGEGVLEDRLEKLAEMKKSGALTAKEFTAAKKKLLQG